MQPKFLLLSFVLFCYSGYGQFVKGHKMVGSSIASSLFSSGTTDLTGPNQLAVEQSNKNFNLQLTPSIGWFVSEKTVVGANLFVSINNQTATNSSGGVTFKEDKNNNLDLGAGGYVRQYLSSASAAKPFLHLHLTAGTGSTDTEGFHYYTEGTDVIKDSYTGKSDGKFFYNTGVNIGITKLLNPNAGIDLYVGYLYSYTKRTTASVLVSDHTTGIDTRSEFENTQKFTGHGVTFGIGFQIFLSKK